MISFDNLMLISSKGKNHQQNTLTYLAILTLMRLNRSFYIIGLITFLVSCSSARRTTTVLRTDHPLDQPYNKIIVIAITGQDSLRTLLEEQFVDKLKALGYQSESSASYFGIDGLNSLGEEAIYLKFCDEGVDAILTIIPVLSKDALLLNQTDQLTVNSYYYNRIWQYPKLRADPENSGVIWETVLFDLPTLSPHYSGQNSGKIKISELAETVVDAMRKSGVLKNWAEQQFRPRPF